MTEVSDPTEAIRTKAAAFPDSAAACLEVAGAYAMFDGPESPLTQTFGLGMFEPATDAVRIGANVVVHAFTH